MGKFKDETNGVPIKEFVGLKAKMYSYTVGNKENHTAKGISKAASRELKHEMYKKCLFEETVFKCDMNLIRSVDHVLQAQTVRKKALVCFDDKRYILNDGITTRPYGHKDNI